MIKARVVRTVSVLGTTLLMASCNTSCGPTPAGPGTGIGKHPVVTAGTPTAAGAQAWSISPVDSVFSPACYCTNYLITIAAPSATFGNDVWRVTWRITLTQIDPTGSGEPGDPGSAAAVDPACNNNGVATASPLVTNVTVNPNGGNDASITWYHPDPTSAPPGIAAGLYHCDHTKQGPRGHQGTIMVTVVHGAQSCTASYEGTISGRSTNMGQPGQPTCTGN